MNRIAQLGDEFLQMQSRLGLPNPENLNPGLTDEELAVCPLLKDIPLGSELHGLYGWRNGSKPHIPMGKLWIVPGHHLFSAQESVLSNRYMADKLTDWEPTWFPIMTSGSSDFHFFDRAKIARGVVPIFYSDPEFSPGLWQIYDCLEALFKSILECYAEGAYFVGDNGFLRSDARRETAICRRLNPESDHWRRTDLYRV